MRGLQKGAKPETTFMDEESSIKVKLISYPDVESTKRMLVNVCYGHGSPDVYDTLTEEEKEKAILEVIEGGTLPKALEMTGKFVFLVENISLTITHCLVRHRLVTVLQRSTAVDDLRFENFLMPRSFARNPEFYEKAKQWYLDGKKLFCEAVDNQGISVQNARLFIPKNNCNHMFMGFDIKAFSEAYGQRMDTQEEPIQNNIVFKKMAEEILKLFPYFKPYFKSHCEVGKCLHCKPGKHSNIVFKRDALHRSFLPAGHLEKNPDETLHDKTRDEMNAGPIIADTKYIGDEKQ